MLIFFLIFAILLQVPTSLYAADIDPETRSTETGYKVLKPATVIESVRLENGKAIISGNGAFVHFQHFSLADPPRLIVDIPDVRAGFDTRSFVLGSGFKTIRVGRHPDKLRFVFDAPSSGFPSYMVKAQGNDIAVEWTPARAAASSKPPAQPAKTRRVNMVFRDVSVSEAFEIIAKKERINIVLGKEVSGNISLSLYEVSLEEAIEAIAEAAGFGVEKRPMGYVVLPHKQIKGGEFADTEIFTYKVQYSDPDKLENTLSKHLSDYGKITVLESRKLLIVEDLEESLVRIKKLLKEIDSVPRQILIEAKILEVVLDESETYGIDWAVLFDMAGGEARVGLQGFASRLRRGFVASLQDSDTLDFVLNLLSEDGRVHTLSTPKLHALENQQAEVIIGDRQGYRVTTTINQVTTESVEFLDSGVILEVTPSVDAENRILMSIHPEVSTGSIVDGLPTQTTTEVTTDLLAEDGQPIFIGGLIKNQVLSAKSGIPVLKDVPGVGRLFSSTEDGVVQTETVVIITPYLIKEGEDVFSLEESQRIDEAERKLLKPGGKPKSDKETMSQVDASGVVAKVPEKQRNYQSGFLNNRL